MENGIPGESKKRKWVAKCRGRRTENVIGGEWTEGGEEEEKEGIWVAQRGDKWSKTLRGGEW